MVSARARRASAAQRCSLPAAVADASVSRPDLSRRFGFVLMNRIVKRADFLAAAKAERASAAPFSLQARDRNDQAGLRLGLTVTKKVGNAVERNRIRRRLRAAARAVLPQAGKSGFDYVVVARRAALTADFSDLTGGLEKTLKQVHKTRRQKAPAGEE
jgi:ribonuclease P protein component